MDRITKVTYPDTNDIDFEYYKSGKVKKRTDQRDIVTDYKYDDIYHLTDKVVTGNDVVDDANEVFTYDGLARMKTAKKEAEGYGATAVSEVEYAYNGIGRITDVNETLFGGTKQTIDYAYDQAGFLTGITYPTSDSITIIPDWQGRISSIVEDSGTIVSYKYIGSRVRRRKYDNLSSPVTYNASYDSLGRITTADSGTSGAEYAKFDYDYEDFTNNIRWMQYDHRTSPVADPCTAFTYDNLNRLTVAEYGIESQDEEFTYDDLGNRDYVDLRVGAEDYVVDANNNRYDEVGGNSLSYNKAGDLTTDKNGYKYEYDYENRIVRVKDSGDADVVEYVYDALGRRIRKIDSKASTTNLYYYSTDWQVLEEADGSGTFQRLFVYGNYIDEVLVMIVAGGGDTYYYVHDHLFSPVALVDGNGDVAERYEYDAYGACRVHTDDGADDTWLTGDDTIGNSSANGNPYLFTGRRLDILDSGSLKIQYNRNRYYDPETGRWLTHDPLGITPNPPKPNFFHITQQYKDGVNLYQYLTDNPIIYEDAFGLWLPPGCFPRTPCSSPGLVKYDWWTPRKDGQVKCVTPCRWRNRKSVGLASMSVSACRYVELSAELPLAKGCGKVIAIAGSAAGLIQTRERLCNLPMQRRWQVEEGDTCECRVKFKRKCVMKCCSGGVVRTYHKTIEMSWSTFGEVVGFKNDRDALACTCRSSIQLITGHVDPDLVKALNKHMQCDSIKGGFSWCVHEERIW